MCNLSAGISMQEFFSREFSSRREYYQDFASRQDSHQDPRGEFFLGGILMSTDFSAGFLQRYGIFPGKDPAGKTGHLDLPGILAGSPYLFYKGIIFTDQS